MTVSPQAEQIDIHIDKLPKQCTARIEYFGKHPEHFIEYREKIVEIEYVGASKTGTHTYCGVATVPIYLYDEDTRYVSVRVTCGIPSQKTIRDRNRELKNATWIIFSLSDTASLPLTDESIDGAIPIIARLLTAQMEAKIMAHKIEQEIERQKAELEHKLRERHRYILSYYDLVHGSSEAAIHAIKQKATRLYQETGEKTFANGMVQVAVKRVANKFNEDKALAWAEKEARVFVKKQVDKKALVNSAIRGDIDVPEDILEIGEQLIPRVQTLKILGNSDGKSSV